MSSPLPAACSTVTPSATPARAPLASLAFQHHDDRLGDPSRVDGRPYLVHERSSGSSSVPPPAGRTRPDHICSINEKHCPSLIVTANGGAVLSERIPTRQRDTLTASPSSEWTTIHASADGFGYEASRAVVNPLRSQTTGEAVPTTRRPAVGVPDHREVFDRANPRR